MRKHTPTLRLLTALLAVGAVPLHGAAQGIEIDENTYRYSWTNACGTLGFTTCASVELDATWSTTATALLKVRVKNLAGSPSTDWANTIFTRIGFDNLSLTVDPDNQTTTMDGAKYNSPSNWIAKNGSTIGGVQLDFSGSTGGNSQSVKNGVASSCATSDGTGTDGDVSGKDLWVSTTDNCITPGNLALTDVPADGWVWFSFTVGHSFAQKADFFSDFNDATLAVQAQNGGPDGEGSAQIICQQGDPSCTATSVVPEPVSMLLLGSGLAGIGGAHFRRRRRGGEDDPLSERGEG